MYKTESPLLVWLQLKKALPIYFIFFFRKNLENNRKLKDYKKNSSCYLRIRMFDNCEFSRQPFFYFSNIRKLSKKN